MSTRPRSRRPPAPPRSPLRRGVAARRLPPAPRRLTSRVHRGRPHRARCAGRSERDRGPRLLADAPHQAAAGVAGRGMRSRRRPRRSRHCPRWCSPVRSTSSASASRSAALGDAFLLQGGDCAETFVGATADQIRNRVKTILQMAVVLTYARVQADREDGPDGRPVREAAFQRDRDARRRDPPAYRGDIVNGYDFTPESRQCGRHPARGGVPHGRGRP